MNAYTLAMLALMTGLAAQIAAAGLAARTAFRLPRLRVPMALAIGFSLLALHHVHSLELGLRTGLYDLRQSLIGGAASLLFLWVAVSLRPPAETPPPR